MDMDAPHSTAEIARRVVGELAPDELASFDLVAAPYLRKSAERRRPRSDGFSADRARGEHDNPLGFGIQDALTVVTPAAVLVSGAVTAALADGVTKEVRRRTDGFVGWLRQRLGRRDRRPETFDLNPAQLTELRRIALDRAKALGMKPRQARALADAVVGALVLRSTGHGDGSRQ